MTFDIPINFKIEADSEKEAEDRIINLLKSVMKTDGNELGILDWEFFEFLDGID